MSSTFISIPFEKTSEKLEKRTTELEEKLDNLEKILDKYEERCLKLDEEYKKKMDILKKHEERLDNKLKLFEEYCKNESEKEILSIKLILNKSETQELTYHESIKLYEFLKIDKYKTKSIYDHRISYNDNYLILSEILLNKIHRDTVIIYINELINEAHNENNYIINMSYDFAKKFNIDYKKLLERNLELLGENYSALINLKGIFPGVIYNFKEIVFKVMNTIPGYFEEYYKNSKEKGFKMIYYVAYHVNRDPSIMEVLCKLLEIISDDKGFIMNIEYIIGIENNECYIFLENINTDFSLSYFNSLFRLTKEKYYNSYLYIYKNYKNSCKCKSNKFKIISDYIILKELNNMKEEMKELFTELECHPGNPLLIEKLQKMNSNYNEMINYEFKDTESIELSDIN